ncbi:S8 family serine peptidase [Kordia jejudonensis]|uniref:S8 family serine peptidase n=1 Tax=Kordia jejudonensis TaxID=1348245 RepID=UPI00069B600B|nr:S8 family serine peptidase [Kordia jejudonensis]
MFSILNANYLSILIGFFTNVLALLTLNSCALKIVDYDLKKSTKSLLISKKQKLSASEWQNWQHSDPSKDTISGISTFLAHDFLKDKKSKPITIAIIDSRFDITHKDLEDILWINADEIPNNNIDDDNNGYIDDIHGWNFLGNSNGKQVYRTNGEYTRLIREYKPIFDNYKERKIPKRLRNKFDRYKSALEEYDNEIKIVDENIRYLDSLDELRIKIETKLTSILPKTKLSVKLIDSLSKINEKSIEELKILRTLIAKEDWAKSRRDYEKLKLSFLLNLDSDGRDIIGDKSDNINDTFYGNNKIYIDSSGNRHSHAIKTIGVIFAKKNSEIGVTGIIRNEAKAMILPVAPYGDTHDKDIALAIRYAVDNGADIINMSLGKEFSLYEDWVIDAIKYASINDVLIIKSAGNRRFDLDKVLNYPNDAKNHSKEYVDNFLKVGATTNKIDSTLVHNNSSYGKKEVDIFAPGKFVFTTLNDQKYGYRSGTSLSSALVSGIAGLIRSYYPNLTASEVKQIIMESGVSYDIMVNKPSTSDKKELVPFSSLSKSGKIVNAYNALLMAEEVSKKKNRK